MHFSIDRIVHTTAFDKPVVDHWLERKISQTAAGSTEKDRSDDRPLQRRARYRLSYIPLPHCYIVHIVFTDCDYNSNNVSWVCASLINWWNWHCHVVTHFNFRKCHTTSFHHLLRLFNLRFIDSFSVQHNVLLLGGHWREDLGIRWSIFRNGHFWSGGHWREDPGIRWSIFRNGHFWVNPSLRLPVN